MIRSWPSHRSHHGVGVISCPVDRGEKPVQLFKQWISLHIAPSVGSPFKGQFNQTQMVNDIIKNKCILKVSSTPIFVLQRPIKVEVS